MKFDAEIPLEQITPELFQSLSRLEPFGMGNPEPVFAACKFRLMTPPRVIKDKHVKLRVNSTGASGAKIGENQFRSMLGMAILLNVLSNRKSFPETHSILPFTLTISTHPDSGGVELSLKDFSCQRRRFAGVRLRLPNNLATCCPEAKRNFE